jgi:ABC-2 type transport system permease protein
MLKKYYPFLRANLMTMYSYRLSIFAWFLVDFFYLIMMIFLWQSIYAGETIINGYTINDMMIYFLLVGIIGIFANTEAMWTISEELRQGQISMYLIKPINYKIRIFFGELGNKIGITLIMLPTSIIVLIVATFIWNLNFNFTALDLLLFVGFMPLIFIFIYEFNYLFGLISIYTTNAFGLAILMNVIISIGSGSMIPLNFYPQALKPILRVLPFQYVYNFPVNLLLGYISPKNGLIGMAFLILWIAFFKAVNHYLFKLNEKKIVIFGG